MAATAVIAPPPIPIEQDRWLSTSEAAEYLSLTPDTLKTYRRLGIGPQYTTLRNRVYRYRLSDMIRYCLDNQGVTDGRR